METILSLWHRPGVRNVTASRPFGLSQCATTAAAGDVSVGSEAVFGPTSILCPLFPHLQTSSLSWRQVGDMPKGDIALLFDHLVGAGADRSRYLDAEGLRRFQVDDQLPPD